MKKKKVLVDQCVGRRT